MFLYKQEADCKVYAGAVDYKGQVRIPFIYDENFRLVRTADAPKN